MKLGKKFVVTMLALVVGTTVSAPFAIAQSWQDIQNDRNAIGQEQSQIRHDRRELRDDWRDHDYGAAREEQREIRGREEQLRDERHDLHSDWMNHAWRSHEDDRD